MSRRIKNITELREEIYLLERRQAALKEELRDDVEDFKEALNPLNYIAHIISHFSGIRIGSGIFTKSGFGEELKSLLKQVVVKGGTTFFVKRAYATAFGLAGKLFKFRRKRKKE